MSKVLIHIAHPAQFHMFKNLIRELEKSGHTVKITINSKDILEDLLIESGLEYKNILKKRRKKNSRISALLTLFKKDLQLFKIVFYNNFDILIGTESALAHVGFILRKKVITMNEDDASIIKDAALVAFPFTTKIVAPNVCNLGKYERKKIGYDGYQKLAYLSPKYFSPDMNALGELKNTNYYIIRLSSLNAYHDRKASGFDENTIHSIIARLQSSGEVYISAENELPESLKKYRLKASISDIHNVLYHAKLLICDSQSMAVESAILGTPSIRYNTFVGKISVLEELEHKYGLTFGIKPPNTHELLDKIDKVVSHINEVNWKEKRRIMLNDKIDVVQFWHQVITNFTR